MREQRGENLRLGRVRGSPSFRWYQSVVRRMALEIMGPKGEDRLIVEQVRKRTRTRTTTRVGQESSHYFRSNNSKRIMILQKSSFQQHRPADGRTTTRRALIVVLTVLVTVACKLALATGVEEQPQQRALNYLLFSSPSEQNQPRASLAPADQRLDRLLRDANHSHISDRVTLHLANSVWSKMRQNALDFARQRTEQSRPAINRLLEQANVSSNCKRSLNDIIDHLAKLDDWAVQMYNAFGDFPATGLFEGTHTSMGSYHQCVKLEANQWIGQAQYCTFKFQPVLPKRPRYHNILARIDQLANFTSKDDVSVAPLRPAWPVRAGQHNGRQLAANGQQLTANTPRTTQKQ